MKSIQPFIQSKVIVLPKDASVQQAARAMREHQIGCVIVSDHRGHLIGLATDRDIVSGAVANGGNLDQIHLERIMSPKLVFVSDGADVKDVVHLMEDHGIRRIPVIHMDDAHSAKCLGIITLDDLVAAKAINLQHLSRIVRSQLRRKYLPGLSPTAVKEVSQERERFYNVLARWLDPKLDFTRGEFEQMTVVVAGALVERLHHTAALRFIGGMPAFLRLPLLSLPVGPNDSKNMQWLVSEVCRLWNVDGPIAEVALMRFGTALEEWCDSETIEHVKAQLPKDLLNGIFSSKKNRSNSRKGQSGRAA